VRKDGSAFDLPIALGVLAATEQLDGKGASAEANRLGDYIVVGELGLEGDVRPVRGALCIAVGARAAWVEGLIVPASNIAEADVVQGLTVLGARSLGQVVDLFSVGQRDPSGVTPIPAGPFGPES
jgi:magnesium chelatase family protein